MNVSGVFGSSQPLFKVNIAAAPQQSGKDDAAVNGGDQATLAQAESEIRDASRAFAQALQTLRNQRTSSGVASINALTARVQSLQGAHSLLQSTFKINIASANPSSTSALGFNLTTALSKLFSSRLGLDTTSPLAASALDSSRTFGLDVTSPQLGSFLRSASALGLDLTSPDTASKLTSALILGLDLTSPQASSVLKSSAGLGLDITSPETASQLLSAALGLDLSSEGAPSKLLSALVLGLDITSPETASKLFSSALGLDLTSPNAASRLASSIAMGLDITSPEAASQLYSAILGLDTTSPDAASTLSSSAAMGLILSQAVSTLSSSALGLYLTSPDRASTLSSSSTLGVDTTNADSTITSTAGMNTSPTSFSAYDVAVSSGSAHVQFSGTYNGNATALKVTFNGVYSIGSSPTSVSLSVTDQNNNTVGTFSGSVTANQIIAIGNTGLEIRITSGSTGFLLSGGSAQASVSQSNPTVSTTAAFNASWGSAPLFDNFGKVTAGSFTINGTTITVNANDSLNSVISSINSSAAGVTASVSNGKVTLTSNSYSQNNIVLANDTSGFLAATKLATATTTVGHIDDRTKTLNTSPEFSSVTSGSFTINGVTISINSATDTLNSVITTINNAHAGVTAAYNASTDKIVLTGTTNSEDLINVSNDTTGFLTAARLSTNNTVRGHLSEDTVALYDLSRFSGVTNGSFVLNGQTINVSTSDTIQSIVSKINNAGAGVTASFNATTNTIDLATNAYSADNVAIGSDTSGFLAATGISAANTIKGHIRDDQQVLSRTGVFGSVASGSFTINGVTISVNRGTDTLTSIINRINGANAGVTATYNSGTDKIVLTGTTGSEDLINVGNDTTGLLTAAHLSTNNTVRGHLSEDGVALYDLSRFSGVTNGSFVVDGETISVTTSDTINSIVNKINASGARVTAAYNAGSNKISLTTTFNSEDNVSIGSDTSGFLAAAGITSTNTTRGNLRDDRQVLSKTSQFAGVATGSFNINGVSISVNKDTDTLTSLISRINGANAGVTAAYDSANDKLVLTGTTNSEDLIAVGGDTSGFLTAAHLSTNNTVRGHLSEDDVALYDLSRFSSVTNGSFVVDGKTINVSTSDTIQSIVSKINNSGARVTAAFDAASNKVTLNTTFNTEDNVSIGSDTSGFLTAAGISSANTVKGNIRDDQQVLSKTSQFGSVANGSFTINGISISLNKDTDTLTSVMNRINTANAGVTATYDSAQDKLVLTGTSNSEDVIAVGADTTGFLTAAHLASNNTIRGHLPEDTVALYDLSRFSGVTDGSFVVDGQTVQVRTSDTIQSLVSKINNSGARVTAAFDTSSNKIRLTTTSNTEDNVAIGSDTSGFLAAAGIDSANTTKGNIRDDQQVLSKTSQFGSVTSGTFTINGVSLSVNKDTDSLASVIASINSSAAGVTASYDSAQDKLVLSTNSNSEDQISVGSDTTGFLSAAKLSTGNTVRGNIRDDQQVLSKTSQFATVADGSFTINGKTVAVNTSTDSLASIVGNINNANAGVTAAYDSAQDKIVLTGTTNSEELITVAGDTSGFSSAAHLSTGNTVRGHIAEDGVALRDLSNFQSVGNGSFTVDGKTINVDTASDTIQSIVQKINTSGARVTAAYDAPSDRITFLTTFNTEDAVSIGNDTSGFLTAAHLDAANTVAGNLRDDQQVLSKTAQFGSVASGTFEINGKTITVDTGQDSLTTLIDKINNADAAVTASYDNSADKIHLVTTSNSADLIAVDHDTTGFLSLAHLDTSNTVRGHIPEDQQLLSKLSRFSGVTSGSFNINGQQIALDVNQDTIQSLSQKINAANAGVAASYDAGTDQIKLQAAAAGADLINVATDNTGFLAAAGLDSNNTIRGRLADDTNTLSNLSQFAGVTNGAFSINGVSIAVDSGHDTMESLIGKINASGSGVSATYDALRDRLVFTSDTSSPVSFASDTSGFLTAAKVPTAVNPDAVFNGTAANAAIFDPGQFVNPGSFTVNGVRITVAANDTINSVLGKIGSSSAGVTANFDPATQTVKLQSNDMTASPIVLGNDTSGLLSAIKLDGTAASTPGWKPVLAFDSTLADIPEYANVRAGVVTIDKQQINIDPATTTVRSLVSELNGITGVSATLDEQTGKIKITSKSAGASISLSDTAGILSDLHINHTTFTAPARNISSQAKMALNNISSAIDDLNRRLSNLTMFGSVTSQIQSDITAGLTDMISSLGTANLKGVTVVDSGGSARLAIDGSALVGSLNDASKKSQFKQKIDAVVSALQISATASPANWNSQMAVNAYKQTL